MLAKGLQILIQEIEGLHLLGSHNKGADELQGYRAADLRLCFCICKKQVFSWRCSYDPLWSITFLTISWHMEFVWLLRSWSAPMFSHIMWLIYNKVEVTQFWCFVICYLSEHKLAYGICFLEEYYIHSLWSITSTEVSSPWIYIHAYTEKMENNYCAIAWFSKRQKGQLWNFFMLSRSKLEPINKYLLYSHISLNKVALYQILSIQPRHEKTG